MNTKKRNIFLLLAGIFIFGIIGVYANTVITNSNIINSNITTNDSGQYYNSQKTVSRTADVVVCRGTSLLDDLFKTFTCDILCASTDSDCGDNFNAVATTGKTYIFRKGNYPIATPLNISSNCIVDFQNSILNSTLTSNSLINIANSQNVTIKNFIGILNKTTSANQVNGLSISVSKNIIADNFQVYNAEDQDVEIKDNSSNVWLSNFYLDNAGRNGIFIGFNVNKTFINKGIINNITGSTAEGYGIMLGDGDIYDVSFDDIIINNPHLYGIGGGSSVRLKINKVQIYGTATEPDISLKFWSCEDCEITNNLINGSQIGIELLQTVGVGYDGITNSPLNKTTNTKIIGNNIMNVGQYGIRAGYGSTGINYGNGRNVNIIGNTINQTGKEGIDCSSKNCIITGNTIENTGYNGIWIHGNTSSQIQSSFIVSNNIISNVANTFSGIRVQNTNTSLVSNNVIKDDNGDMTYGVYSVSYNTEDSFVNNLVTGTNIPIYGDNYGYYEGWTYGVISAGTISCTNQSAVNDKIISNTTTSCKCKNGSWKCWAMS